MQSNRQISYWHFIVTSDKNRIYQEFISWHKYSMLPEFVYLFLNSHHKTRIQSISYYFPYFCIFLYFHEYIRIHLLVVLSKLLLQISCFLLSSTKEATCRAFRTSNKIWAILYILWIYVCLSHAILKQKRYRMYRVFVV